MDDAAALADAPAANAHDDEPCVVGNQTQAAAALGLSIETFRELKSLPGFPGENGRYNIPAIREWMGQTLSDDESADDVAPDAEDLAEPLPPPLEVVESLVEFPLAEPRPGTRYESMLGRIDISLKGRHRRTFRRVMQGLVEKQATLADGRPVGSQGDFLRWLMEQLEPNAR